VTASSPDRPVYAWYVVVILFVVYLFNFIDRNVLNVLVEPIKAEFGLSDTQIGFLTGPAFAVVYAIAGIPIARWADRGVRRSIISWAVAVWSAMTALSGMATGFWTLAAARIGVGVGEAGGTPPSHSLISDYIPPARRALALAIQNSGHYAGILFGMTLGGLIAESFGWRGAFLALGLPGILLAILVRVTIVEPPRGRFDPHAGEEVPGFGDALSYLLRRPSFRWLLVAGPAGSVVSYAFVVWGPALLSRTQGASLAEAGTVVGLSNVLGGVTGSLLGGLILDALGRRDLRWHAWAPAVAMLISTPFYMAFVFAPGSVASVAAYGGGLLLGSLTAPAIWTMVQEIAPVRMRALATAMVIFASNMIGLGGGPQIAGILNDWLEPTYGVEAVRWSLLLLTLTNIPAALAFAMISRSLRRDVEP
jgi:MFS family permease